MLEPSDSPERRFWWGRSLSAALIILSTAPIMGWWVAAHNMGDFIQERVDTVSDDPSREEVKPDTDASKAEESAERSSGQLAGIFPQEQRERESKPPDSFRWFETVQGIQVALADPAEIPIPEDGKEHVKRVNDFLIFQQLPLDIAEVSSETRKTVFVDIVRPMVWLASQEVLKQRCSVADLKTKVRQDESLSPENLSVLSRLASSYRLEDLWNAIPSTQKDRGWKEAILSLITDLLYRIDSLPSRLMLAQAAIESGWGTSRFARQGNALFGQWTTNLERGLRPLEASADQSIQVLTFDSLEQSVASYLKNVNTHAAYIPMRRERRALRSDCPSVSDHWSEKAIDALTETMSVYAQTGELYVKQLNELIRQPELMAVHEAR